MDSPTPRRASQNFSFFESASEELYDKLRTQPGTEAAALTERARQLREGFRGWVLQRPSDDERVRALQDLLDFAQEAHEFLAHQ
jgi:hypothetical protein